ncbi:MAG: hypothetical protein JSU04_14955 [Bdellovibrionales bacterium]|nr:hypothetical protein [Bdellovibrionales bacterium]
MRLFPALLFFLAVSTAYSNEDLTAVKTVLPLGALSKGTTITWDNVDSSQTYFVPGSTAGSYEKTNASGLLNVKSISNSTLSASDTEDLVSRAASNSLVVQKSDLQASSPSCLTSSTNTCTLQSDTSTFGTGIFDLIGKFFSMLNPFNWFKSSDQKETGNKAVVNAMNDTIAKGNSVSSGNAKPACGPEAGMAAPPGMAGNCGIQQALDAYRENKSKIDEDIIVFNDFSDGGLMGKMWFLKPDGTPANIIEKNPIWVSRGAGGFGAGAGSQKTPNGAIMTKSYRPPRAGNINDGITLVGLESGNRDITDRGVLLHGWDPFSPTAGCLGVAGTIDTDTRGQRVMGSPPPYLDELKTKLFAKGSVMIYNFTPAKKALCK